ncbi:MAG: glycosyltransferase family 4 protein [Patescibacteria group bacterium]|nr:glycosyltransferase family 4 protein [Patescibacteria group bacterium]
MARIAVFSLAFHPFVGGAEIAIAEIAKRCPEHQFVVFTARLHRGGPPKISENNITVVHIGRGLSPKDQPPYRIARLDKYRFPWLAARVAAKEHRDQPFDLIWGMMASWGGWAALKFKDAHPKIPYVLTEQSGDSDAFIARRTWFWRRRYAQIYTAADRVTVISNYLAQRVQRSGVAKEKISLVPNGVNFAHFSQPIEPRALRQWREKFHLAEEDKVIISISRLVEKNGLDTLIRAVALLRQKKFNVKLLIVGSGPLEKKLSGLIRTLKLDQQVIFSGYVAYPMLPSNLGLAQVFSRPSRSEGFGNVFIEAMAAGVPVVATPVGGIIDFLQDGVNGYMAQPNDPQSVADAIVRALSDRDRDRIIQNGKATAQRYDWAKVGSAMDQVFQSALKL